MLQWQLYAVGPQVQQLEHDRQPMRLTVEMAIPGGATILFLKWIFVKSSIAAITDTIKIILHT